MRSPSGHADVCSNMPQSQRGERLQSTVYTEYSHKPSEPTDADAESMHTAGSANPSQLTVERAAPSFPGAAPNTPPPLSAVTARVEVVTRGADAGGHSAADVWVPSPECKGQVARASEIGRRRRASDISSRRPPQRELSL